MGQKSSRKAAAVNPNPILTSTRLDALSLLPDDLVWHCKKATQKRLKWDYEGNEDVGYFWKEFPPNSEDYNRALKILQDLEGGALPVKSIYGVYNPLLVTEFATNRKLMEEKLQEQPWTPLWNDDDENGLRSKVSEEYSRKVSMFAWNKELKVPVIPAIHGTGMTVAKAITKTGFAAISSLDSGFFGKGIYFSTSSKYALPYATLQADPALIISYVVPGNIYPTSEQHKGPTSLAGKPIRQPGYHSHYVLTKKDGFALSSASDNPLYDEIVIPDESQVTPAFLVELETGPQLKEAQKLFERELMGNE